MASGNISIKEIYNTEKIKKEVRNTTNCTKALSYV
jgi:hypothetical protein